MISNFFSETFVIYEVMNMVEQEETQAKWLMSVAWWISKSPPASARAHTHARTHTHPRESVNTHAQARTRRNIQYLLLFLCKNGFLNAP
jgi:hypothetical protein